MKIQSEEIRLRYFDRRMVIDGKTKISLETARALVGPDAAYHLYSVVGATRIPLAARNRCRKAAAGRRPEKNGRLFSLPVG